MPKLLSRREKEAIKQAWLWLRGLDLDVKDVMIIGLTCASVSMVIITAILIGLNNRDYERAVQLDKCMETVAACERNAITVDEQIRKIFEGCSK